MSDSPTSVLCWPKRLLSADDLRQAVAMVNGRAITEASGGITSASAPAIAATGVDLISIARIQGQRENLLVASAKLAVRSCHFRIPAPRKMISAALNF